MRNYYVPNIYYIISYILTYLRYGVFSRDMAAMLVSLKKGTAAVMSPTNHPEIELYSYANVLFWLKTMLIDHSISLDR